MKRTVEPFNLVENVKILKRNQSLIKFLGKPLVFILLGLLILQIILFFFGINAVFLTSFICSFNLLGMTARNRCNAQKSLIISRIISLCNNYRNKRIHYIDENSIEIVPGSLKIGEDLSSRNVVPIFKQGKYVIIRTSSMPAFFFQPNQQDIKDGFDDKFVDLKELVDLDFTEIYNMESTDEDIELLEENLPQYKEEIKSLKLYNIINETAKNIDR